MINAMTFALQLTHDEPKLVYLALRYHLARPGSELDATTRQPVEHGLAEVARDVEPHLDGTPAVIELDEPRYRRLLSAIYGSVNELRVMHMGTSAVPGFDDEARALFPGLAEEPDLALSLAESMMMLHRRMQLAVSRAAGEERAEDAPRRRRWPFGR